jgi:hypothetical protein
MLSRVQTTHATQKSKAIDEIRKNREKETQCSWGTPLPKREIK